MGRVADALEIAALPVRPWRLARAAAALPTPAAAAVGLAGASLCLGIWVAAYIGGNEPFRDMAHYAREWVYFAVFVAVAIALAVAFVVALGLGLVAVFLRALDLPWPRVVVSPVLRALVNVILLAPYCGVLPLAGWSLCAAIASVPHPSFGMASGKPAWVTWAGFAFLSQGRWLVLWLVGLLALAVWQLALVPAAVRSRAMNQEFGCRGCGYSRAGLAPAAVCPECGAGAEPVAGGSP